MLKDVHHRDWALRVYCLDPTSCFLSVSLWCMDEKEIGWLHVLAATTPSCCNGLNPSGAVSQSQLLLPEAAFAAVFHHRSRKGNGYNRIQCFTALQSLCRRSTPSCPSSSYAHFSLSQHQVFTAPRNMLLLQHSGAMTLLTMFMCVFHLELHPQGTF